MIRITNKDRGGPSAELVEAARRADLGRLSYDWIRSKADQVHPWRTWDRLSAFEQERELMHASGCALAIWTLEHEAEALAAWPDGDPDRIVALAIESLPRWGLWPR